MFYVLLSVLVHLLYLTYHSFFQKSSTLFGSTTGSTVISGTSYLTGGGIYSYGSLTINSGSSLVITSDGDNGSETPTVIRVNGPLIINGYIQATEGSHGGGVISRNVSGLTLSTNVVQQSGGYGGSGYGGGGSAANGIMGKIINVNIHD